MVTKEFWVTKEFCLPSSVIAMTNLGRSGPNPILINASRARLYVGQPTPQRNGPASGTAMAV
jgi:hypothetical protein